MKVESVLKKYEDHLDDRMWMVEEAGAGVPVGAVYELMGSTHLNKDFFARVLNLSTKTLDRYRLGAKKLSPAGSEIILKMHALFKKGEEIFGNQSEFQKWIEQPAYGLGSRIPKTMIQTSSGIDLVMDELTRIEFGDLA
jgi:putative toxin-antitoxin system antitoxin component (TIGR02293 family)